MARSFLVPINLNQLELQNPKLQQLAADPGSPVEGQFWENTAGASGSVTGAVKVRMNAGNRQLLIAGAGQIVDADISATAAIANGKLATNPLARANHTGTQLSATISDLATTVQAYRLDQFAAPTSAVSMGSQQITNVADPTTAQSAATKNYVDGLIQGVAWKNPVRVASTGNISVSGWTTATAIDGVTLANGDRVLLKNQTAPAENGIYYVVLGALGRATDADTASEVLQATVMVEEGTTNADTIWTNTTNAPITLGTTGLTFVQIGAPATTYTASTGVTKVGVDFQIENSGVLTVAHGGTGGATVGAG